MGLVTNTLEEQVQGIVAVAVERTRDKVAVEAINKVMDISSNLRPRKATDTSNRQPKEAMAINSSRPRQLDMVDSHKDKVMGLFKHPNMGMGMPRVRMDSLRLLRLQVHHP